MKIVEVTKNTLPLADYTKDVDKEPIIVMLKGKPIAALVSINNTDIESVSLSSNQQFLALIERSRVKQKVKGGISTEEMRSRLQKSKIKRRGRNEGTEVECTRKRLHISSL